MPSSAFITLIPARLESTRLPNKPLLDLAGQPMIVRVAKQAQSSGAQAVIVATDSTAIVEVCQQAGIKTVLTDKHHPSGTDRLAQAAVILEIADDTLVVNLQGDEPLVHPELLSKLSATNSNAHYIFRVRLFPGLVQRINIKCPYQKSIDIASLSTRTKQNPQRFGILDYMLIVLVSSKNFLRSQALHVKWLNHLNNFACFGMVNGLQYSSRLIHRKLALIHRRI